MDKDAKDLRIRRSFVSNEKKCGGGSSFDVRGEERNAKNVCANIY